MEHISVRDDTMGDDAIDLDQHYSHIVIAPCNADVKQALIARRIIAVTLYLSGVLTGYLLF